MRADALGRAKDFEGALEILNAASDAVVDSEQADFAGLQARYLARMGKLDAAIAHLSRGKALLTSAGRYTEAAAFARSKAFHLQSQARFSAAQAELEDARAILAELPDPVGTSRMAYHSALLDRDLSRHGRALKSALKAGQLARTIGDLAFAGFAEEMRIGMLSDQGRLREALKVAAHLPEPPTRERWRRTLNLTWLKTIAMRNCELERDFRQIMATFQTLATQATERTPASRANAWVNAGYAAWLAGAHSEARAHMEKARSIHKKGGFNPHFTAWLDASLTLDSGDPAAAEARFEALAQAARSATGEADGEYVLRAFHGLGAARLAQNDAAGALSHWRAAVAMLERLGERSQLLGGRSAYHAARDLLLDDLLRLLLDQGRLAEALRLADRARAPVLHDLAASAPLDRLEGEALRQWTRLTRQYTDARARAADAQKACRFKPTDAVAACKTAAQALQEQADKQLEARYAWLAARRPPSTEALPALPKGHALLAMIPLKTGRSCAVTWAGLLLANDTLSRVDVARLKVDPSRLLAFEHLYIVDAGDSPARMLPEWAAGDAVLAERIGVSFIPRAAWLSQPAATVGERRVAIADPASDLPHSRKTANAVPADTRLIGPAATRDAVLTALDGARWLHFDGHGDLGNGRPGDAHLVLADAARLTLHDVLVRRPRIGTAVLSGCEVGKTVAFSAAEGVGLAEGFLLAGTDRVLAPNYKIGDETAARFLNRFYAEGGMQDPAAALRRATATLRAKGDDAWKGWRLFGRR